jgi:glycine cleavage system H protein
MEETMDFPEELKYTEDHEWVLPEGDLVSIGISDFAQDQLGDVVFVELPEVGDKVVVGKPFGVVESVKAVSDIYAPLAGEVVEVNSDLPDSPESLNTSPYEDGWMIRIKPDDMTELDGLMDASAYQAFIEQE